MCHRRINGTVTADSYSHYVPYHLERSIVVQIKV